MQMISPTKMDTYSRDFFHSCWWYSSECCILF